MRCSTSGWVPMGKDGQVGCEHEAESLLEVGEPLAGHALQSAPQELAVERAAAPRTSPPARCRAHWPWGRAVRVKGADP